MHVRPPCAGQLLTAAMVRHQSQGIGILSIRNSILQTEVLYLRREFIHNAPSAVVSTKLRWLYNVVLLC